MRLPLNPVSRFILALLLLVGGCQTPPKVGQTPQQFQQHDNKNVRLDYWLYLPQDYNHNRRQQWPLMLFLHGAGERGTNLTAVLKHGPPKLVHNGKQFSFIIVSPQCPPNVWWSVNQLDSLLDHVITKYRVDTNRVYLTGLSMGGFGTWALAAKHPDRFAAIAPICGGGQTNQAQRLKDLPIWVFHGAKDKVVPIQKSQEMVDALKAAGASVEFTIYPDAEHDSWTATYDDPKFYEWLLQQRRSH